MEPAEFYFWLKKEHPELVPEGFGSMLVCEKTVNLIGSQVGFREVLGFESRHKTLEELKKWIDWKYANNKLC